jgi:hypothetical protein
MSVNSHPLERHSPSLGSGGIRGCTRIDIDRVGKTMPGWSPSPIRSLRPAGAAADRIERVGARLQLQRGFTDGDLDDAVRLALRGLIQRSVA